jgi:hypothetical protein
VAAMGLLGTAQRTPFVEIVQFAITKAAGTLLDVYLVLRRISLIEFHCSLVFIL